MMKTRIDQWEAFIAVAKEKNYKRAREELLISTPMLSRKIQDLEKYLNTRLLHRTTRSVELTHEGQELNEQATELIEQFYRLEEYSNQLNEGPLHGDIKITAPRNFADLIFPKVIPKFQTMHPQINIEVNFTDDFVNFIEERIDLAIRMGNIPNTTMIGKKVTENKLTICASPKYLKKSSSIKKPQNLKNHSLLYLDSHKDLKFKLNGSKNQSE